MNREGAEIIAQTYRQFEADYKLEHFETYEDMCEYWSQPDSFERLSSGNHGKLNSFYIFKLLSHYDEFLSFIKGIAHNVIDATGFQKSELIKAQCNELLRFSNELLVDSFVNENGNDSWNSKVRTFAFDIVGWRTNGYDLDILNNRRHSNFECEFYLTNRQKNGLKKQMKFFGCGDRMKTLRKMFDANPYDFFYNVKKC
ncbi:MAG: hypothetical protein HQ542_11320 [Bacteroidia bacterium]|nr:hypothetical protein [Bacteroidia bacterium]